MSWGGPYDPHDERDCALVRDTALELFEGRLARGCRGTRRGWCARCRDRSHARSLARRGASRLRSGIGIRAGALRRAHTLTASPSECWSHSVATEAFRLGRPRTTAWWRLLARTGDAHRRPRPVVFDATARLIRRATHGEPDRSDSQCHEFIVSVVADLVADCQGVAPLSIRRPGQSRRFDPAYSRPASGPTRALLHACP